MTANRIYIFIGGIMGFLGVVIGAFGAHTLKPYIMPEMLDVFKTGVLYQLIHAVAITALSLGGDKFKNAMLFFTIGVVLFSFSLYAYTLSGVKGIAMVTPFGGVCFLIGWVLVIVAGLKK